MIPVYAIDSETHLIRPGLLAPPLVCVTWATRIDGKVEVGILDRKDGLAFVRELLKLAAVGKAIVVLQNGVYDMAVFVAADHSLLSLVFAAYDAGTIRDTRERQKLIDLADGTMKYTRTADGDFVKSVYTLEALAKRHLDIQLDKSGDSWRLRYAELDGVPLAEWPPEAIAYAVHDSGATLEVYEKQNETVSPVVTLHADGIVRVTNEEEQLRAAWGLHLQSVYGMRIDPVEVAKLKAELEVEQDKCLTKIAELEVELPLSRRVYKSHTYKRGVKAGTTETSRNMKVIEQRVVEGFAKQGLEVPRTATGKPQTSEETLRDSKDPILFHLAEAQYGAKLLSSYVPKLAMGAEVPLRANYNLLLETGRTSCPDAGEGNINPQVMPRKEGVRQCIIPRDHFCLASSDYAQLELCTLAQVHYDLFGASAMRDAINAGQDLHIRLAAVYLGKSYEETLALYTAGDVEVDDSRQLMKPANFGFPGGMGALTFIDFCRAAMKPADFEKHWGCLSPEDQFIKANHLREVYLAATPEQQLYFKFIGDILGPENEGTITCFRSGRIRGGVGFTQACNNGFQALAADGAKHAVWRVARECYEGGMYVSRRHVFNDGRVGYSADYIRPEDLGPQHGAIDFGSGRWRSPLFGSRPIAFIHDQLLVEVPQILAHEAGTRLPVVMVDAMKEFVPDVRIAADAVLMKRWFKGAKSKKDENGRLVPWEPKAKPVVQEAAAA